MHLENTKEIEKIPYLHFSEALPKRTNIFKLFSPSILKRFLRRCLNIVDNDDTNNGRWRLGCAELKRGMHEGSGIYQI